ncbi:MAG: hypothetical protein AABY22_10845 [Nanoarchaeota archaeon]|mgnify:CR=1 FL=1
MIKNKNTTLQDLEYIQTGLAGIAFCTDLNKDGLQTYAKHLYKIMKKLKLNNLQEIKK